MRLPNSLSARTRRLNRRRTPSGRKYVLCWLQQTLRAWDNPVLDVATTIGNNLDLPVLVYHGLDNRYPYASHRLHRFILEASRSLESDLTTRGFAFCRYVRRPNKLESGLVYRLAAEAAAVVTDDIPVFVAHRQASAVAREASCPVHAVDSHCVVPMQLFEGAIASTKSFRAASTPLRQKFLEADTNVEPTVSKYTGKVGFRSDPLRSTRVMDKLAREAEVDMHLPPTTLFLGGRKEALRRLRVAADAVVPTYKWTRNNPSNPLSTSMLSPYMHFGVLGPREVSNVVYHSVPRAAAWKFLDELLTWREYYFHLAHRSKDWTSYEEVPVWARTTLKNHASDARPTVYSLQQLENAETGDDLWNAAQLQFLLDGWMHNNLRMYWVKQIIKWVPTPLEAWDVATYLNDKLSLDGRDPSTYGGIQWGFGNSRRAYREKRIYGWVPDKSSAALMKRNGVKEWVRAQLARR